MKLNMHANSAHNIVSSPFGDVVTPNIDLYSFITASFEEHLNRESLRDVVSGECYTYSHLRSDVGAISRHLSDHGFRHNSVLAVFSSNSLQVVVMVMAAWRLGGTVAGINHLLKTDEVRQQLRMCDAVFLFTASNLADTAMQASSGTDVKKIYLTGQHPGCESFAAVTKTTSCRPSDDVDNNCTTVHPQKDTAIILFSSGTTGSPKGVQLTHYNFISVLLQLSHPAINTQTTEHTVIFQPLSHVFGLQLVAAALQLGRTILLLPRFQLDVYLDVVSRFKIRTLLMVPPIAVLLAKSPVVDRYDLSSVRYISCGSAPLTADVEDDVRRRMRPGVCIGQGYGLTETSAVLTVTPNPDYGATIPSGTVGQPLPGTLMKVIDLTTGRPVAHNTRGEICARGPQIMSGYLKNDTATREMIDSAGWLHTGDIGYYDKDGYFFIVDRLKELIKYNAYQVSPSELEGVLLRHLGIVDAGVFGLPDPQFGELPTALVVRSPDSAVTEREIQQYIKDSVASFKQLRGGVFFVSNVPRTATGKPIRRAMRAMVSAKSNL